MNEDNSSEQRSTYQFYATIYSFCDRGERVTLASGLKLALVYKQISQVGLPYTRVNFTSIVDVFIMRDILYNGPKFEITLKFSIENTFNSRKKENILSLWTENNFFIFQDH